MIHPLWSYLEIELSHFTYRFPNNGFDFFMQPVSESTVRRIDFGEINFAAHFVAYEKLQRFDKIDVSQNTLLCPARTVARAKRPPDLRVFSQTHMDSPLREKFLTPIDSPNILQNQEFKLLFESSQLIDPVLFLLRYFEDDQD